MPISEAKFEELKNLVSSMKQDIAINQANNVSQWELLKASTESKIDTITLKIDSLGNLTDTRFKGLESLGMWIRWVGGIGLGFCGSLLVATVIFAFNAYRQGGVTDGKVEGISRQINEISASMSKMAISAKPDDPAMRAAVANFPARFDRIDQKIDQIVNSQARLPLQRIICEGTVFSQNTPSSLVLSMRSGVRTIRPGIVSEGIYDASLADRKPNDDPSLPYAPSELINLPTQIALIVTAPDTATIAIQFSTLEDLARFRTAITPVGRMVLDIYRQASKPR
jgi:hypothetical protein